MFYTEPGHQHINEDAVALKHHWQDDQVRICALADGQGGRSGGARAAQVAVAVSMDLAMAKSLNELATMESWREIAQSVDQQVYRDNDAGFTTLINLAVINNRVIGVSAGDSAALLLNDQGEFILTEQQRKNPPVGSGGADFIGFNLPLGPQGRVLIMSDGVWKYAGWHNIINTARTFSGQELIENLRKLALKAQGGLMADDFTIALL